MWVGTGNWEWGEGQVMVVVGDGDKENGMYKRFASAYPLIPVGGWQEGRLVGVKP